MVYSVEEEQDRLMSKINSAGLINLTLKNLWDDYYRHFRQANYSKANADLDCLWIEFGGDEDEESASGKKNISNFNVIETEVAKVFVGIVKPRGFNRTTSEEVINLAKQCAILKKKALFLKRLMNSQGKGTAYEDRLEDYIED